ncbi:MAG TPA: hypothetical protein VK680_09940 [Solirubrobacteraceae bacterium]|jgi:hypothetical protein|nr:hypothetical protein [Solirubrobacteraceae bacterium]
MQPDQFQHVVAAAANVTGQEEFVMIGSQAILGSVDDPPASMLVSLEADIYPLYDPPSADLIDGALGDGSQFHVAFGYYARGVGPETAKAPSGWQDRLVRREIPPRVGSTHIAVAWCLEPHDLVLSKCVRGTERDWEYASEALKAGLVRPEALLAGVADLPVDGETQHHISRMLRSAISGL